MQIVSLGDSLQEMSRSIFKENKKKNFRLLSAVIFPSILSVNP